MPSECVCTCVCVFVCEHLYDPMNTNVTVWTLAGHECSPLCFPWCFHRYRGKPWSYTHTHTHTHALKWHWSEQVAWSQAHIQAATFVREMNSPVAAVAVSCNCVCVWKCELPCVTLNSEALISLCKIMCLFCNAAWTAQSFFLQA